MWTNTVKQLNIDDHSAWRVTRALINKPTMVPPLKINGQTISVPQEKADILASTLKESFTPNNEVDTQKNHYNHVQKCVQTLKLNEKLYNFKKVNYKTISRRKATGLSINEYLIHRLDVLPR
jgi:hypothetical protein